MGNPQHLELIKQGPDTWNRWREEHAEEPVDLSESDLRGTNLKGVNLKGANLKAAKLQFANLAGALLEGADLSRARLQETNLEKAQLPDAVVSHCNLMESNVQGANFERADLSGSQFNEDVLFFKANLKGANLTNASGLHPASIQGAILDKTTKLPDYLTDDLEDEEFLNSFL